MKRSKKSKRMTEEDLKNILKNKSLKITEQTINNEKKTFNELLEGKTKKKTVNKSAESYKKIVQSLRTSTIVIDGSNEKGKEFLAIWFDGARVLSLNNILNSLEKREYEIFNYKKEWQKLINKALLLLPHEKRTFFDSPCKVTLFRQGVRLFDLDGFQSAFKYAIDALRYSQVLAEDNPNIMFDTIPIQKKGKTYITGLKIEKIQEEVELCEADIYSEWFSSEIPKFEFK